MSLTVEIGHLKSESRFLQNGWQKKMLSEISNIVNGYSFKSEDFSPNNSIQSVKITNVGVREFIKETSSLLPENFLDKYSDFKVFKGDIVIALTRSIISNGLKVALVPDEYNEALLNQRVAAIKPNHTDIIEKFLFFYFCTQNVTEYVKKEANTLMQPNLSIKSLKSLLVPIPPLPEQKRIVAILDEAFEGIDRAITNAEKNLANSRALFESYLNAIFTQKGDGWVEKKLGDVCEKVEYGSSAKSLLEGEIAVLRMGNIQNGTIDWNNLLYTSDKEEINKYLLKYNDVLFNRTNSDELVGKTAIYKGETPAIFAGYLIRIHRKEELIDADFLNFYLNSYRAREYGKSVMSRSVNQANINGTKLKGYPIFLPSLSIQKEIVKNLNFLRTETQRLEAIYRQKIAALNELKQSILQKAFTGELTADTLKTVKEEIAA